MKNRFIIFILLGVVGISYLPLLPLEVGHVNRNISNYEVSFEWLRYLGPFMFFSLFSVILMKDTSGSKKWFLVTMKQFVLSQCVAIVSILSLGVVLPLMAGIGAVLFYRINENKLHFKVKILTSVERYLFWIGIITVLIGIAGYVGLNSCSEDRFGIGWFIAIITSFWQLGVGLFLSIRITK